MKKLINILIILIMLTAITSCDFIEEDTEEKIIDEYIPEEKGQILTKNLKTGELYIPRKFSGNIKNLSKDDLSEDLSEIINLDGDIYDINNYDKLIVQIGVSQSIVNQLDQDSIISLSFPGVIDKSIEGEILNISDVKNEESHFYSVDIIFENQKGLRWDMMSLVEIKTNYRPHTRYIENNAIINEGEENYLLVIRDNEVVKRRVITGIESGGYTEILLGVRLNDEIIVLGHNLVEENEILSGGEVD